MLRVLSRKLHYSFLQRLTSASSAQSLSTCAKNTYIRSSLNIMHLQPILGAASSRSASTSSVGIKLLAMQDSDGSSAEDDKMLHSLAKQLETSGEPMSPVDLSNCLCGLQKMSGDLEGAKLVLKAVVKKLASTYGTHSSRTVAASLYGLQNFSSDIPEVREILRHFTNDVLPRFFDGEMKMTAEDVGTVLYGLQGIPLHSEVECEGVLSAITAALSHSVRNGEVLDESALAMAIAGFKSTYMDSPSTAPLLQILTQELLRTRTQPLALTGQNISLALYGLQSTSSCSAPTFAALLSALTQAIDASPRENELLEESDVAMAFYGLQGLSCTSTEVCSLLSSLIAKVKQRQRRELLSPYEIANCMWGIQSMVSETTEVQMILNLISISLHAAADTETFLNKEELVLTLHGAQGLDSAHNTVRAFLAALDKHIRAMQVDSLEAREISMLMHGLQRLDSADEEVLIILEGLYSKTCNCRSRFDLEDILTMLPAFSKLSSDHDIVRKFISFVSKKVFGMNGRIPFDLLCLEMEALSELSTGEEETRNLLAAFKEKIIFSKDTEWAPQHISSFLFGMQRKSPEDCNNVKYLLIEVLQILKSGAALNEMNLSANQLGNAITGFRNMSCGTSTVRELISILAEKVRASQDYFGIEDVASSFLGMESMTCEYIEAVDLLVAVREKLEKCEDVIDPERFARCLQGLRSMDNDHKEVKKTIDFLIQKIKSQDVEVDGKQQPLSKKDIDEGVVILSSADKDPK